MAKAPAMTSENQYDERRDLLVVETKTTFPAEASLTPGEKSKLSASLHAQPNSATFLEYIRCPTGFVRHIRVTAEDVDRVLTS